MSDPHSPDPRWKHDGVRVVPADKLDPNTAQTPGMFRQAAINKAQGEASAILAVAEANALAIQKIAQAIQSTGGMEAVNLKVAEQYVTAFGNIAKSGNTLIVPGNLSDMSSMIASALAIVRPGGAAGAAEQIKPLR